MARNLQVSHNTVVPEFNSIYGTMAMLGDSPVVADNFVFKDNIIWAGEYGFQTSSGAGVGGLNSVATNSAIYSNLIVGEVFNGETILPNDTIIPINTFVTEFQNYDSGDMRLSDSSTYRGSASDGTDPGADFIDIICAISKSSLLNTV
jgi:hypothetical protein